jgi:CheY-like chemotaxis protein
MMLLITSFIAVLASWSLLRVVMQRTVLAPSAIEAPRLDSLYFEMRTGLIIAAGTRIAQLLGYACAADCLARFDRAAHFKNASLVQLIGGDMSPAALVLQTAQGEALAGDLRIRVIAGVEAVEVQAATKVERRARALKPLAASGAVLPVPRPSDPGPLFSVLAASHARDSIETYHAVFDRETLRLQPSPDFCSRMGFPVDNRGLSMVLWRRCLDPDDRERVLQGLTGQSIDETIFCRVATLAGELLFLRLVVIALPDSWSNPLVGRNGDRGAGLLKIQVDQQALPSEPGSTVRRHEGAPVDAVALQDDKAHPEQQGLSAQSTDELAILDDEMKLAVHGQSLPALESEAHDCNAENIGEVSVGQVLLIEDDRMVRQALLPILSEARLSVTSASSLGRAINLWQSGAYDLVITDRNLGGDSILPLLDEMAYEQSTVPVLLMTAAPFDHPAVHTTLAKPFDLAAFQVFLEVGLSAMQADKAGKLGLAP